MPHYVLDARTATPHFPGIGRYVTHVAQALIPLLESGERLTVLHDPTHPLTLPSHEDAQVLPVAVSPFSLSQQWRVPRLLRSLEADLYHSAYNLMPYRPGVAAAVTLHDLIPMLFPEQSSTRARYLFRWATALALGAARAVIAVSESTRRDLQAHFWRQATKIVVIPEAADPRFRPQAAETVAAIRARYALPDAFLLYLGSNKPHKNLVRLVEAFSRITDRRSGSNRQASAITLVIAGAWNPQHTESQQRAEALGLGDRVRWLGPLPGADLPALYAAATAFIFPSLYEGFGLPVIEAMACGAPVACADTSSLPEVAGDAGLLFDPTSVAAIAEAMRRLLDDGNLRIDLRERGPIQAARFSWARTAKETLALYRAQTGR